MIQLSVNSTPILVPAGTTVLQACEALGFEIPRFCYHSRLLVAGNCRICLVEVLKSPKPIVSCAIPVGNGMEVLTDSPQVYKAREGVLELLLLNHPLDCPICDQGGECDLQDQAIYYGSEYSRSSSIRRGVSDKYYSPLVSIIMTRCIHCTRCIRYSTEIQGSKFLGATGRGNNLEIGTYDGHFVSSGNPYIESNVIDLCPVGALTSSLDKFTKHSWEPEFQEGIDPSDATGSWITRIYINGYIQGARPRDCSPINKEWLSDKSRYFWDGLTDNANVLMAIGEYSNSNAFPDASYVGKDFGEGRRSISSLYSTHSDHSIYGRRLQANTPEDYTMLPFDVISSSDLIILYGVIPLLDSPLLDLELRSAFIKGRSKIVNLGEAFESSYDVLIRDISQVSSIVKVAASPILLTSGDTLGLNVLTGVISTHPGSISESVDGRSRSLNLDVPVSYGEDGFEVSNVFKPMGFSNISFPIISTGADEIQRSIFGIPNQTIVFPDPNSYHPVAGIINGISWNHPVWVTPSKISSHTYGSNLYESETRGSYNYFTEGPWFVKGSPTIHRLSINSRVGFDSVDLSVN